MIDTTNMRKIQEHCNAAASDLAAVPDISTCATAIKPTCERKQHCHDPENVVIDNLETTQRRQEKRWMEDMRCECDRNTDLVGRDTEVWPPPRQRAILPEENNQSDILSAHWMFESGDGEQTN